MLRQSLLATLAALTFIPAPTFAHTVSVSSTPLAAPTIQVAQPISEIGNLLPADTVGLFLINTRAAKWRDLSKFGLFPENFSFPSFLYTTEAKVNFSEDVQPWLGEQIGYAFLPSKAVVTIATVKNAEPVAKYIEAVKSSRTKPVKEQQYKGITILEWEPEPIESPEPEQEAPLSEDDAQIEKLSPAKSQSPKLKSDKNPNAPEQIEEMPPETDPETQEETPSFLKPQPLAIAVLPNAVISSNSVAALQQIIDAQTSDRLSSQPKFQSLLQHPNYERSLFVGYGKFAEILKAANELNEQQRDRLRERLPDLPNLLKTPSNPTFSALENAYDTMSVFAWAEQDGIHFQFGVDFKQALPEELLSPLTTRNEILTQLPEVNYMMTNSQNLSLLWSAFITGLELQPAFKPQIEQFRKTSQSILGIDDRDIFPWMSGEYAIFSYPTREGFFPQFSVDMGLGVMVQTSDRATADAAISKMNNFIKPKLGDALFRERTLAGQPSFSLGMSRSSGKPLDLLSYGWVNPNSFLVLTGGAFNQFSPKPARNLTQSANFKSAIAPLGDANMGYFYMNFGAVMSLINNSLLPMMMGAEMAKSPLLDGIKDTLGSIRSISASGNILSTGIESRGFMALAVTRKPEPTASETLKIADELLVDGDRTSAIEEYNRAIELEPENTIAYADRGTAHLLNENYPAAIADYDQAIRRNPNNADYYLNRGRAKSAIDDYQAALADFDQAIALNSNDASFFAARAEVHLALENYSAAIADSETALKLDEHLRVAHGIRCYARARGLQDFQGALEDCNEAIGEPEIASSDYLSKRCYVRASLKDETALEDCDRATELADTDPHLFENRGLAKAALGNHSDALIDLQQAATLFAQTNQVIDQRRVEKVMRSLK